MNTILILQICLVLHLTGLALMAGTTVVELVIFNQFCRKIDSEKEKSITLLELMSNLTVLLIAGAILLIVSGIGLLIVTNGVFVNQLWFIIKMGLIATLILNGIFFGSKQESKLKKIITGEKPVLSSEMMAVNSKLKLFYISQAAIFFTIIFLAIFKLN